MASKIPKIKETISAYICEENGRITKQSVLSLGAILAAGAISSLAIKNAKAETQHQHSHLSSPHSSHSSY